MDSQFNFYKNNVKIDINTENMDSINSKERNILKNDIITTLGYGPQGRSQSLNLRDNNFNVIVGCRKSDENNSSWNNALKDGWTPNKNLFEIEEACDKGTIIQNLLSDAKINT